MHTLIFEIVDVPPSAYEDPENPFLSFLNPFPDGPDPQSPPSAGVPSTPHEPEDMTMEEMAEEVGDEFDYLFNVPDEDNDTNGLRKEVEALSLG